MSGRAQGFVSRDCGRAVFLPWPTVLAYRDDRDDRGGLSVDDGAVTAAGVIATIYSRGADLFTFGDQVEQFRQDRTVAIAAGGDFHRPDVLVAVSMAKWTSRHWRRP